VDVATGLDVALLVSVPEERPVVDIRLRGEGTHVPLGIPGVDVRVEVDDRDGSVNFVQRFQNWEDLRGVRGRSISKSSFRRMVNEGSDIR